jgi:hypothetical protein
MTDLLSNLVSACSLAREGVGLVSAVKRRLLTRPQREILRAVAATGDCAVLETEQLLHPVIRAGRTDMGDERDPMSLATYSEAFKSLCEYGYFEYSGGILFRLTAAGFRRARRLQV